MRPSSSACRSWAARPRSARRGSPPCATPSRALTPKPMWIRCPIRWKRSWRRWDVPAGASCRRASIGCDRPVEWRRRSSSRRGTASTRWARSIAALPPQRALDASAAAALQDEGFQVARPAAMPDAMRYRECHLTLRPRYGHGSLEDTYRATIRTVVVSEPNRPRRSARRALAELTTALHTYTLVEPGQAHPTPLVPISRVGSALRVIAGVVFLTVVGWTLLVPVVSASLPLLPERFIRVRQLVDHVRPWLIGLRHPSPPALLGLGLLVLTAFVLLRVRAQRARTGPAARAACPAHPGAPRTDAVGLVAAAADAPRHAAGPALPPADGAIGQRRSLAAPSHHSSRTAGLHSPRRAVERPLAAPGLRRAARRLGRPRRHTHAQRARGAGRGGAARNGQDALCVADLRLCPAGGPGHLRHGRQRRR